MATPGLAAGVALSGNRAGGEHEPEEGGHPFTHLDPAADTGWWSWVLDLDPFSPTVGGDVSTPAAHHPAPHGREPGRPSPSPNVPPAPPDGPDGDGRPAGP